MNVKKRLESIEEMVIKIGGLFGDAKTNDPYKMSLDVLREIDLIREAIGLPMEKCLGCGLDGLYECVRCEHDYCGGCCEEVGDGFLCHNCKESGSPKGWVLESLSK